MKTYNEIHGFILDGRNKKDRPTEKRATRLYLNSDGSVSVRYHRTDVVTHYRDGRVVVNSGGWGTPTTKRRIMQYSRAVVWQKDFTWYINIDGQTVEFDHRNGHTI